MSTAKAWSDFLIALRPLLDDTPAQAALDKYMALLPRAQGDAGKHHWLPLETKPDFADAPKRARVSLEKAETIYRCALCKCFSNRAYPYWFLPAGGVWQMAKPPCAAPPK